MKTENLIKEENKKKIFNNDLMNEELREWIRETKTKLNHSKNDKKKSELKSKKPKGKCEICGEKTAKEICLKCEKSVCISCYFQLIGICKRCVLKETADKWKNKRPDWEKVLDVKWVG